MLVERRGVEIMAERGGGRNTRNENSAKCGCRKFTAKNSGDRRAGGERKSAGAQDQKNLVPST